MELELGRAAHVREREEDTVAVEVTPNRKPATNFSGATRWPRAPGVTLFSEPVKVPRGVVKFAAGDKSLCYFLDPDGTILELCEYR